MKIRKKHLNYISWIITILFIVLIFKEAIQYNKLPSKDDPISTVVDFFKYKENAITNGVVWLCGTVIGIVLILKTKK